MNSGPLTSVNSGQLSLDLTGPQVGHVRASAGTARSTASGTVLGSPTPSTCVARVQPARIGTTDQVMVLLKVGKCSSEKAIVCHGLTSRGFLRCSYVGVLALSLRGERCFST